MTQKLGLRLALSTTVLLGGCATTYQEPGPGSPAARLQVTNLSRHVAAVQTFGDAETCTGGRKPIHTGQGVSIDKQDLAAGTSHQFSVHANKKFALYVGATGDSVGANFYQACDVVGIFTPEVGRSYVATYRYEGGRCGLAIVEQDPVGTAPKPVAARYAQWKQTSFMTKDCKV